VIGQLVDASGNGRPDQSIGDASIFNQWKTNPGYRNGPARMFLYPGASSRSPAGLHPESALAGPPDQYRPGRAIGA